MEPVEEFRYAVKVDDEWLPDMIGTEAADGSNVDYAGIFGHPITYITIGGVDKYRVFSKKGKWSEFFTEYDKKKPAGNGSPILAIEIHDKNAVIGVHILGGSWLPSKKCTGDYAGCMSPIDGVWIEK